MRVVARVFCFALVFGCSRQPVSGGEPAAAKTPAVDAKASDVPELVSGVALGPVRIGMNRAELDAIGLKVRPGAAAGDLVAGPYTVSLEEGRVSAVSVELKTLSSGLRVRDALVDPSASIADVAKHLPSCGQVQDQIGARVVACDGGRSVVLAGGPVGIVTVRTVSAARAAKGAAAEATWTHPGMKMSFSYPTQLLTPKHKPDGASLISEPLGTIEDRSGQGRDAPGRFEIVISRRIGSLLAVMKQNPAVAFDRIFPKGDEASFHADGAAERTTIAGAAGYRIEMGSHDTHVELFYAAHPTGTLEASCSYVGDMAKPKVSMTDQQKACKRVLETLVIER
jgi:hypothetical protein